MSTKTRRLNRAWRPGAFPPALHNDLAALHKHQLRRNLAIKRLQHATLSRMHAASAETAVTVSKLVNRACPACNGEGIVSNMNPFGGEMVYDCPDCHGTGLVGVTLS